MIQLGASFSFFCSFTLKSTSRNLILIIDDVSFVSGIIQTLQMNDSQRFTRACFCFHYVRFSDIRFTRRKGRASMQMHVTLIGNLTDTCVYVCVCVCVRESLKRNESRFTFYSCRILQRKEGVNHSVDIRKQLLWNECVANVLVFTFVWWLM